LSQLRIGIHTASLRQPLKKALHTAARLGASAVEIDARSELRPGDMTATAVRQFRKLADDYGLKVCSLTFQTRRGYNVAEDLERRIDATKEALRLAYDLGASVVSNYVGHIPAEPAGPEWELLTAALSDIGSYAMRAGATLCARTGAEEPARLATLIDALPEGSLGVDLDPGGLIINSFSATDAVQTLGPHILHVHARDGVRDLAQGRGVEVPLGRGTADLPTICGTLEEHGYRGWFTVERTVAQNPVEEIAAAVKFLKSLWA